MGSVEYVNFKKPCIKQDNESVYSVISCLMSMVGDEARASISLSFSKSAILEIANNFLPEDRTAIDGVVIDLSGEFTNMVMGDAKRLLEEKGFEFDLSPHNH